jgi:hypothetical protein
MIPSLAAASAIPENAGIVMLLSCAETTTMAKFLINFDSDNL